jgi:hypothetical protein
VEKCLLLNPSSGSHPQRIVPLEHADVAIASRTNLTTGITKDATLKLPQPEGCSLSGGHPLQFGDINKIIIGFALYRLPD